MTTPATASQTVGPYFSIGLSYRNSTSVCSESEPGEHLEIAGRIFDGEGVIVPDAQLEIWQADSEGRFVGFDTGQPGVVAEDFAGFARIPTDLHGGFRLHTIRPGAVAGAAGVSQAPHIVVLLSMRGLLRHLITRIYFEHDPKNAADPVLLAVPEDRRHTLVAKLADSGPIQKFQWDIHLQGDDETVFFAY
jgi:protocatechuate 3,4-dioxygenase alpha subunit